MNAHATTVLAQTPREEMLALMRRREIHHLPLLDDKGIVVGLVTLDQLIGAVEHPTWVVIMAGGQGRPSSKSVAWVYRRVWRKAGFVLRARRRGGFEEDLRAGGCVPLRLRGVS
jgi:Mg/Co/Ni transporter MgtE